MGSEMCIRDRRRGVEGKTTSGFCPEVQKSIETADKEKLACKHGLQDRETESGDTRVDKLFQDRKHENSITENRRAFTNPHEDSHMETMEEDI